MARKKRQPVRYLMFKPEFCGAVGTFYSNWAALELTIDLAIGKLLAVPHEVTHLLTAGLDFHRKARILRALIRRSNHPQKAKLLTALNKIQNESKRNVFAHSYLGGTDVEVTYLERSRNGELSATEHTFTAQEFVVHVARFVDAGRQFASLIGRSDKEIREFLAAIKVFKRAGTSPQPPKDSA